MEIKCNKCKTTIKKLDEEKDKNLIQHLNQDISMGLSDKSPKVKFGDVFRCEACSEGNVVIDDKEMKEILQGFIKV